VKTLRGRPLQGGEVIAELAVIGWTGCDGQPVPWTGWLTLAEGAGPVAAGVYFLALEDGQAGGINLFAEAQAGRQAPFGHAGYLAAAGPAENKGSESHRPLHERLHRADWSVGEVRIATPAPARRGWCPAATEKIGSPGGEPLRAWSQAVELARPVAC
jgi:hypothetical protein